MSRPNPSVQKRVRNPQFGGALPDDVAHHLKGLATAKGCGDVCTLKLGLDESTSQILAARHSTYGCPPAIAAAEWLCEFLEGRQRRLAEQLRIEDVHAGLDLEPEFVHAALLVVDALEDALK